MSLYLPQAFDRPEHAHTLMREHPLAQLITVDDAGFPFVTPLPLVLDLRRDASGERAWLLGHVARGNPQAQHLAARPEALACFMGPQGYMPATVYPDLQRVPTWNYLTVHARVKARLLEGDEAKDSLLKSLIAEHDAPYAQQWRSLPEDYARRMLAGITAFELEVVEIHAKLKLNQHRPEAHARMHAHYARGSEQERALARWMQTLGMA